MRIDRSQFLALTATLAAGCAQRTSPPPDQPATVVDSTAIVHVDNPPAVEPIFPDTQASAPEPLHEDDKEAWEDSPPTHGGHPGIQARAGLATGPDPLTGPARACSQLRAPPGPHCESFDSLQDDCETIVGALVPTVAERTMQCLQAKSGTRQICDMFVTPRCAERALVHAPRRPATARPCQAVSRACGRSVSQATCESFLSAVVPPADAQLVTCLTESCDIATCFFQLP